MERAYKRYARTFAVQVPGEHNRTNDPFLLRNAMEVHKNGVLPSNLDGRELLLRRIEGKLERAVGVEYGEGRMVLTEIGDRIASQADHCDERSIVARFPLRQSLFEAALLTRIRSDNGPLLIDFYYSRERDYIVAFWARDWPKQLTGEWKDVNREALAISVNPAGRDALRWYLAQPGSE